MTFCLSIPVGFAVNSAFIALIQGSLTLIYLSYFL